MFFAKVLEADYSSTLALLLRYPSPEPYKPVTFIQDALFLQKNLNQEAVASLSSKYSGKVPSLVKQSQLDGQTSRSRPAAHGKIRHRGRSSASSGTPSSTVSPNRFNQKRLDSLFHDVSAGLQRRGENWGVARAVRGAMVEARRNIQNIQSSASTPPLWHADTVDREPSPPDMSLTAAQELSRRIIALEERNRSLATTLRDAIDDLRGRRDTPECDNNSSSKDNMDGPAITKLQFVQECLEDSTKSAIEPAKPINSIKVAENNDRTSTGGSATSTAGGDETIDDPSNASATSNKHGKSEHAAPLGSAVAGAPKVVKPVALRPATRAPLAESSFSWMLGDHQHRSSFVSSASDPPEHRRSIDRGRYGSLFGDARGSAKDKFIENGEEEVALSRLQEAPEPH